MIPDPATNTGDATAALVSLPKRGLEPAMVAGLPVDAREQFARFVEAVALSPLAGYLVAPDKPGEFPTLLWPL